jgi:metal-dependent amidase/aminoacylase/carboxypeptidase family protein
LCRLILPWPHAIHGGESESVIPDKIRLKLNIRTYDTEVPKRTASMKQIIRSECGAFGTPQLPDITPTSQFPLMDNDPQVVQKLQESFEPFLMKICRSKFVRANEACWSQ